MVAWRLTSGSSSRLLRQVFNTTKQNGNTSATQRLSSTASHTSNGSASQESTTSHSTAQSPSTTSHSTVQGPSNTSESSTQGHTTRTAARSTRRHLSAKSRALLDQIIRVDHAGELGADRIYAGQMAVLGKTSIGPVIQHMWDQEKEHKAKFEQLIPEMRTRPSALVPLWSFLGYALGTGSAMLGREAAMACTVAVESVITDHYNSQLRAIVTLPEYEHDEELQELARTISKIRDEEMEHHDTGLSHNAEQAPAYQLLSSAVKMGSMAAVWVAKRI